MLSDALLSAVEWDAVTWGRALSWAARQGISIREGLRVLEVGGRTGALACWLASQGARVVSIDLIGERPVNWTFPDAGQIHSGTGDVFALPEGFECDLVISKSVLGAIGGRGGVKAQEEACQHMARAVEAASGQVWILENLVASPLHGLLRRRFVRWSASWRYVALGELVSFFGVGNASVRAFGLFAAFGRREWQRRILGWCDAVILERLAPLSWRYVAAVVARAGIEPSVAVGGASDGGERPALS